MKSARAVDTSRESRVESESKSAAICGFAVIAPNRELIAQGGIVSDPRVRMMVTDPDWVAEALAHRLTPVTLTSGQYLVLAREMADASILAVVFQGIRDTVFRFLSGVDFAFDIIEHILADPYDAMAVVDAKGKLVFVSPIHEKFFGLGPGEGIGKDARQVIENSRLHHVARTGVAEVGQIQKMKGRERVVSRHPIRRDGQVVGAIGRVMFKGPQQVEALSRKVNALEKEIAAYRNEAREAALAETFLDAIIGRSAAIQHVRDQIRKIAPLDIAVLIRGESGSGKELVAQALHMMSARRDERLITVNAAALPPQLVESELFGYEAGSFTGADRKGRAGKFEQAERGSIFLDEIGDMPLDVQSKLLRVLQDRVVERVGGDRPRKIDFRLISATNRDLASFVEDNKFRLDLYYRISPIEIVVPALSERVEDIPLLVAHFLRDLATQYRREVPEVDDEVLDYLMDRAWPGNVRELRHVIERAFVFCENRRLVLSNFQSAGHGGPAAVPTAKIASVAEGEGTLKAKLEMVEREMIASTLARFNGNKKKAAEQLGISRTYLYKKLGE